MARPSRNLIDCLRKAAEKIRTSDQYQWGHMGSCNCGYLAQEITSLSKADIHRYAMQKYGDWTEQVNDFCPTSGLSMDLLISEMVNAGLSLADLRNLEKLSDPNVLEKVPQLRRPLAHNAKRDVILYMNTWADILERELQLLAVKKEEIAD